MENKERRINFLVDAKYKTIIGKIESSRTKDYLLKKIESLVDADYSLIDSIEKVELNLSLVNKEYKHFYSENIHAPKELSKILEVFNDEKYVTKLTTHAWEGKYDFDSFDDFIKNLEEEKKQYVEKIQRLNNQFYQIIFHFLYRKQPPKTPSGDVYKMKWGQKKLNVGWQYPQNLIPIEMNKIIQKKEGEPFNIRIRNHDKEMNHFGNYINAFKEEIEFRGEALEDFISKTIIKSIGSNFKVNELKLKSFAGLSDFKTYTNAIKNSLQSIAGNLKVSNRQNNPEVEIETFDSDNYRYIVFLHKGSYSDKKILNEPKLLLNQERKTTFNKIRDNLKSIADFYIESRFLINGEKKFCRLNYLTQSKLDFIVQDIPDPLGFKHVIKIPL